MVRGGGKFKNGKWTPTLVIHDFEVLGKTKLILGYPRFDDQSIQNGAIAFLNFTSQ